MRATKNVFPYNITEHGYPTVYTGLQVRDYIAIQAMQGWVSNPNHSLSNSEYIARQAYKLADAMIKESNNETKTED